MRKDTLGESKIMSKTIIICDDERKAAQRTKAVLEDFINECSIQIYESGKKLIEDIREGVISPELIFMDIDLVGIGSIHGVDNENEKDDKKDDKKDEENGIRIAEEINGLLPSCDIVYLTNYLEYAVDVYNSDHLYYILKPELAKRLPALWEKIRDIQTQENRKIAIALKGSGVMVVNGDDILYAERNGRITEIYLIDGKVETMTKLSELEGLWGGQQFIQCHNSFLINMKRIRVYKRDAVEMKNGDMIPISRKFQQNVREVFLTWSKRQLF